MAKSQEEKRKASRMHPPSLDGYNCTKSEREMFDALRDQLPDRYHVFYSVRWHGKDDKGHRVDSECDFFVLDMTIGFLAIEVKGGSSIIVKDRNWFLEVGEKFNEDGNEDAGEDVDTSQYVYIDGKKCRSLKRSPYMQAELSARHFRDDLKREMKKFGGDYTGAFGYAAAFPLYPVDSMPDVSASEDITIDKTHMKTLANRIDEIFAFWQGWRFQDDGKIVRRNENRMLSLPETQKKRILAMMDKRVTIDISDGALMQHKQKEFEKYDFLQNAFLSMINRYPQARIAGGAGTGKTYIAMKKIMRDAADQERVLFLCASKALASFAEDFVRNSPRGRGMNNIDFLTYEGLMRKTLGDEKYESLRGSKCGTQYDLEAVDERKKSGHMKCYDTIVVDEGQDFDAHQGMAVQLHLKNEKKSNIYVFYDVAQDLSGFEQDDTPPGADDDKNVFDIKYPAFELRYNIRNTGEIYDYAKEKTGLGQDTESNRLPGKPPVYWSRDRREAAFEKLEETVKKLTGQGRGEIGKERSPKDGKAVEPERVKTSAIVILSNVPYERSILADVTRIGDLQIRRDKDLKDIGEKEICFKTALEFKGLEANVVIYLKHKLEGEPDTAEKKKNDYIAYTRAKFILYVIETKMRE